MAKYKLTDKSTKTHRKMATPADAAFFSPVIKRRVSPAQGGARKRSASAERDVICWDDRLESIQHMLRAKGLDVVRVSEKEIPPSPLPFRLDVH